MPASADDIARIRIASRHLVRSLGFLDKTLAGTGMSASSVHAIVEIGRRNEKSDNMTARELAAMLGLEKSTISRLVAGLFRRGELRETSSPADGREKLLSLTAKGMRTLSAIDKYATDQVAAALGDLPAERTASIVAGLETYAGALSGALPFSPKTVIRQGYANGLLAAIVGMHAAYYSRETGFGMAFETRVARDLAEFLPRAANGRNGIWHASIEGRAVGSIAIDGEDLGNDAAHLRWFIVDDGVRGKGLGRRLLTTALDFCDARDFTETHLWTFRGLDAARALYEQSGFVLAGEWQGDQWGKDVMEQKFVRRHPRQTG